MSEREPKLLLQDILDSSQKIMTYTENLTYEEFIANSKTIDAVIRNYEIIGEAANRLPESIKDSMNSIDWFRIRGFRNRVAHQYFGIDYEIVWLLRDTYLTELISKIEDLLSTL